jgi:toxin ParE1/3/4
MARYRLAGPAQADLVNALATSAERWGVEGHRRYVTLLVTAIRQVARDPEGLLTRQRSELGRHLRSSHIRHARGIPATAKVRRPARVLYYRVSRDGVIEIVRVLHERMEPSRHLDESPIDDVD